MDLRILGKSYTIRSSQSNEFTQKAAELLSKKISEIQKSLGPTLPEKLAVMAALNLAGELLELEKQFDAQKTSYIKQIKAIKEDVTLCIDEIKTK